MASPAELPVYLREVETVLPRILASFDRDPLSPTFGVGDRTYWAWKLIDFANATPQGYVHGLARLVASDLLPEWLSKDAVLRRIEEIITGTSNILRKDGSLEEALPFEKSFCVTALIAFDLLAADELLQNHLTPTVRKKLRDVVRPMISFLHKADEKHDLISNHLATASAALFRWTIATGEPGEDRGRIFLERILQYQSKEGWFNEYGGADPGYQSLATYYLADLHRCRPDLQLIEPLRNSLRFLSHFLHPDGSFGGLYGSRNTRFLVPAGLEALAPEISEARTLAHAARTSIGNRTTVSLSAIDAPNLAPMFNAYCWAAAEQAKRPSLAPAQPAPWQQEEKKRVIFHQAGLIVDWAPTHYAVVSTRKGGAYYYYDRQDGKTQIDGGPLATDRRENYYTTQRRLKGTFETKGAEIEIKAPLGKLSHRLPSPLDFVILRLLSLSVMRSRILSNLVKRLLVRLLITDHGSGKNNVNVCRTINLDPKLSVQDNILGEKSGLTLLPPGQAYSAIHMASQGYWQRGDDIPSGNSLGSPTSTTIWESQPK
ncbi:MAG: hypothetical protein COA62_11725 [Rhodobiaceae bacterium]|nr:MAG: hypothetical protein COA62_11725 [Rhodobiaceae bacterium]